ncbi:MULTISPECIES: anthrax toxin lethal factor-related metalloendopeptidase [Geobacillus]|uniref:anthrax toxin lethal factor-related metalloendopeptidase n=1 Tax=Geobacillus TaxID=129337 RepID=UPI0010118B55|nr:MULTISPECIES: toxin [Geobacillus]RXS92462.1 toxin [Geobacillus sp. PK12]WKA49034.1 toxin [Geobacillus zalihae]
MKRLFTSLLAALFAIPLLSFSPYPAAHGVLLEESSLGLRGVPSHDVLGRIIIVPETEFSASEANEMIRTLAHIDRTILEQAADHHIYIQLLTGPITDEPTARHLRGKTPRGYMPGSKTWDDVPGIGGAHLVLVRLGHSEKGKGHGSVNLELHEFAHSLDYIVFDRIHETDEFQAIWREEAPRLFPGEYYFLTYPEEYFAESFAYYYASDKTRQTLRAAAPRTYALIRGLAERAS